MSDVKLLIDGKQSFEKIIELIENSVKTIHINMFIWRDDLIGNRIARKLLDAALRGVKISISKDKYGAIHERAEETKQSFFHKEESIEFQAKINAIAKMYDVPGKKFSDKQRKNPLLDAILNHKKIVVKSDQTKKDHSKYLLFDDEILIVGGINIEDKEMYRDIAGKKYRDYMVMVSGKKYVKQLKNRMFNNLPFSKGSKIDFIMNYKDSFEVLNQYINLLDNAKESIIIENPYWNEKSILDTLQKKAEQGIDISIILPAKANLQHDLNMKHINSLYKKSNKKIKIYLHPDMLHAKLLLIDQTYALIGSSNLTRISMKEMQEMNIFLDIKKVSIRTNLLRNIAKHMKKSTIVSSSKDLKFNSMRAFVEKVFT